MVSEIENTENVSHPELIQKNIYFFLSLIFVKLTTTYFPVFHLSSSFEGQTLTEQRPQGFRAGDKNPENSTETENVNKNTISQIGYRSVFVNHSRSHGK